MARRPISEPYESVILGLMTTRFTCRGGGYSPFLFEPKRREVLCEVSTLALAPS